MMDKNDFFKWEQASRDTVDFKRAYADVAGDVVSGLVLSDIVYWHLPSQEGGTKLRVYHEGHNWVACARHEWWDRVRVSPKQADRTLSSLEEQGLIIKRLFKFAGAPTVHVRINWDMFLSALHTVIENPPSNPYLADNPQGVKSILTKGQNPILPKVEMEFDETGKSLTESTTENTTENTKTSGTVVPRAVSGISSLRERHAEQSLQSMSIPPEAPPSKKGKGEETFSSLVTWLKTQIGRVSNEAVLALDEPCLIDKRDEGLPTPNSLFEDEREGQVYKAWITDEVLPWYEKNRGGGSKVLASALRKYDWYKRYRDGDHDDAEKAQTPLKGRAAWYARPEQRNDDGVDPFAEVQALREQMEKEESEGNSVEGLLLPLYGWI